MTTDLLPPNASKVERALSHATDRKLPVELKRLSDPLSCPASFLPWLAWAMSVDEWNPNWSEEQKRNAVASSLRIHQRKGTVGAMRIALAALGYDIELVEWFQLAPAGDPYTFALMVTVDQVGVPTAADYQSIEAVAENTKNLRSRLTGITVRGISNAALFVGARFVMGETIYLSAEPA